jgi:hypothetical protein
MAILTVAVLGVGGSAGAFEIQTGNSDLEIHWDNSFRYTLGQRLKGQNRDIINSPNNDDGDRNFDVGIVSNRIDLLTELDTVYKKNYGVRLSAAGWYDLRYHQHLDNTSPTSNHTVNGFPGAVGLSSYTKRHFAGPDAELLDAFAFGKFDAADVPVSARVGRHTVYWGESVLPFAGAHGISYGQSPIDLGKALAQPGVELKEIFRPLNQVSLQVQPSKELTIMGQYYLQWEADRFPESGSYLGFADMYLNGGETILLGPGMFLRNGGDITPRQARDWGLAARWSPEWLDGTLGIYYRNFSDKLPQLILGSGGTYHFAYASDIDLLGISLAKNIAGVSVGSEVSYRWGMPLLSQALPGALPGQIPPPLPASGDTAGGRGETLHALVNFLALMPKTPLFDEGSCLLELTYSRWMRVSQGGEFFLGRDGYSGADRVTRDAMTGAINFAPMWRQVLPGVDLTMPLSIASGLFGTSAVATGGAAKNGSYSAGLSFDILAKYTATLTYAGFFGNYRVDPVSGTILPPGFFGGAGDIFGLLKDRNLISLTLKAAF